MKRNIRTIDNTGWIKNLFIIDQDLYLVVNKEIFKIAIEQVIENLKNKADLSRYFLAYPFDFTNRDQNNINLTECEFVTKLESEIINVFKYNNQLIYTIYENKQYLLINESQTLKVEAKILNVINDQIIALNQNEQVIVLNSDFQIVKTLNFKALEIIGFNDLYIVLNSDFQILKYDLNWQLVETLVDSQEPKHIFYLNQNNVLISYRNQYKSTLFNINTFKEVDFVDFYINIAVLVEQNTLLTKTFIQKNDIILETILLNVIS
ncbi:hypothetical protein [Spiroplasma culicicola]|uniref:Uncharacterized protein n=1 Tax=Spiroplasma culicicola AES-1 TaxID=1276246 RepID=W6A7W9_9MOLU|nr:hypothetical protein [Spiroplasma culicicola]AHI53208.1 hypothetical protein SCULI_v1c08680 [Spiroplasma culicicola AES-1]